MALKIEHISGMEFRISGTRTFDKGWPNRAVLAVVYIYDPITDLYVTSRGLTEVAKTTTNAYGTYLFQREWYPGDYVIKFYGTGKSADIQIDTDWEYFSIAQKGIYDITPPDDTEIFQIIY
jgi:hypothetical protein